MIQTLQRSGDATDYDQCDCGLLIPSIQAILHENSVPPKCRACDEDDIQSVPLILAAFQHRAARLLLDVHRQIQTSVAGGKSSQAAWNDALLEMARTTHAYAQCLLLHNFIAGIEDERKQSNLGTKEINVLTDLALLSALAWMQRSLGDFLEDGYLSATQARWVRSSVLKLLEKVRPNAICLVDAFDISDFRLKSVLGRYDGDVYPALVEAAKKDPLNQTEPGPGYDPYLKRLIKDGVGEYTPTTSRL